MLFSDKAIADFVNANFESYWTSLRPVPTVEIDFHNGHVIRRTLQGNIATCVCAPDGQVLDVLPGMYSSEAYRTKIEEINDALKSIPSDREERKSALAAYHRVRLQPRETRGFRSSATSSLMGSLVSASFDGSKAASQAPIKELVRPGSQPRIPTGVSNLNPDETSRWQALLNDTEINESVRRIQIHRRLYDNNMAQPMFPSEFVPWLYKEVLHTDLDDPYLGLGKVLFGNYPFKAS